MATERAIVVDSVYDEFEAIITRKANELAKTAPVLQLVSDQASEKVQGLVDDALSKVG